MHKRLEKWSTGNALAVRADAGQFAEGNNANDWAFEIWNTRKGQQVRLVLRGEQGQFLGATNVPLR